MQTFHLLINIILHLDQHLSTFVLMYGSWIYALLFIIIFCETGLVVTPFLPGDSLLFAAGTLSANSGFNIHFLFLLLMTASIDGNSINYSIGRFFGSRLFTSNQSLFFNRHYLEKAHSFYEKYGNKTLIIARFIPIIRTFAPFVAGMGYMKFNKFTLYNALGAFLWIGGLLYTSYFFGNIPIINEHFSTVILLIIAISLLPPICAYLRLKYKKMQLSRQNSIN
jgi:membrane-associated protein